MDKQLIEDGWVDRYVRGELSRKEEVQFETALLDSPALQDELEAVLAIREAVRMESEVIVAGSETPMSNQSESSGWKPIAMAASVLLAVFSTTMFWKVSNESAELQREIDALTLPGTDVLTVFVDIMRSSGNTPDVVIQKPSVKTLILLDLELSVSGQEHNTIRMTLKDDSQADLLSWNSEIQGQERVSVAIYSNQLPDGRVWLEMADEQGEVFERRLLEFLPPRDS